jgi:hypothetical protein
VAALVPGPEGARRKLSGWVPLIICEDFEEKEKTGMDWGGDCWQLIRTSRNPIWRVSGAKMWWVGHVSS